MSKATESLNRAIKIVGTRAELAAQIGVTAQAISQWKDGVPPRRVLAVEQATRGKVKRHQLRPDIYGQ